MNRNIFPDYLAFGKLNPQSIQTNGKEQTADYELLGETLMKVIINPTCVTIEEVFRDEFLGYSSSKTLENCFMQHYINLPISASPVMKYIIDKVTELGNIYYEYPRITEDETNIVYYPAASLHIIRIPLTENNIVAFNLFNKDEANRKLITNVYKSNIAVMRKGTIVPRVERIHIVEFVTPLAFIHERAALLLKYNLILPDKLHRAIIQDLMETISYQTKSFYGNEIDNWAEYKIEFKPNFKQ